MNVSTEFHLTYVIFQTGSRANGGVESITQVIESLDRKVTVITQIETPVNERWRAAGHDVYVWPIPYRVGDSFRSGSLRSKIGRLASILRTNQLLCRLLRKKAGAHVLHCNDPAPFWHFVPAARICKAAVALNLRDTIAINEVVRQGKYQRKARWSDAILVLSQEMAAFYRALLDQNTPPSKRTPIKAIPSIVDLQAMRPIGREAAASLRTELGFTSEEVVIAIVAAFSDKKNQLEFIQNAVLEIDRNVPSATLVFIGDFNPDTDPYAARCNEAAKQFVSSGRVQFRGYTSDVTRWYQAADLVVVPSRKEGLARCMIESLACGTPVVSFDVCSAREVLEDNRCGLVVDQGDYTALASAIIELANSPERRRVLGNHGAEFASRQYRRSEVVRQYLNSYRAMLARD